MIHLKCLFRAVFVVGLLTTVPAVPALAQASSSPAAAASEASSSTSAPFTVELPARPSEMLVAPIDAWRPVLARLNEYLDERQRAAETLSTAEQIEMHIHRALVMQSQQDWGSAQDAIARARALQASVSGRHLSGLLNELLARHAQTGGDAAALRLAVRERLLAMPWKDVEPGLRALREQLAQMESESVKRYVAARMDLAAETAKGKASLGFALQLLAARFQLQQVIPQRSALLVGIDDALRARDGGR